jgi:hypothetical protein
LVIGKYSADELLSAEQVGTLDDTQRRPQGDGWDDLRQSDFSAK